MRIYLIISLCFILQLTLLCQNESKDINYNFKAPDIQITLPDTLREISGFTAIDNETIACVQDENGIIFIYDIKKQKIKRQLKFSENGDYEGITSINDTIYVLQSDGVIFEIKQYKNKKPSISKHFTNIPCKESEGLFYRVTNNTLLIACKTKVKENGTNKDKRCIYEYNPKTKQLSHIPFLTFSLWDVNHFYKTNLANSSSATNDKNSDLKIHISEIAIHPSNSDIYILSAIDHVLLIFNKDKTLKHIEKLNLYTFPQPEGMSFNKDGDLLISNEGRANKPSLLIFKQLP